jgi:low affinity Fe/Cu permease
VAAIVFTVAWLVFQPETFDWHAAATVATLYIALFIQRATHRDTQALHAKVDELIKVNSRARDEITSVDSQEPEDIEHHRRASAEKSAYGDE